MLRVERIAKGWTGSADDEIYLDHDARNRRRAAMKGRRGTEFLLDLAEVAGLREGDGLVLSSGEVVRVRAAAEPLMEIRCANHDHLARIAWHLGNRHLAAEIRDGHIRIRADHVIGDMVARLGATVKSLDGPFDPEGGAYEPRARRHGHHDDGHHH